MEIPIIDIAPVFSPDRSDRVRVAREWNEAFSTIGFVTITGHGIPEPLMAEVHAVCREFFARPLDEKMALRGPPGLGYEPFKTSKLAQSKGGGSAPPDLVEALMIHEPEWDRKGDMPDGAPANFWPGKPDRFREIVAAYVAEAFALGQTLMRISALALGLDEDFFRPYYDRMMHNLRLAHYPDQTEPPLPGQFRNGQHTDFTGFTILRQDSAPGGLQVLSSENEWVDVTTVPGTLVINSGDLLQRWTNDRWRSNLHRVKNPDRMLTGSTERLSIVMFTGPNPDAVVECLPTCAGSSNPPRYGCVTARDYLTMKIRETFA
jgi:isopenicillin N synthase-like dioxygenase